MQPLVRHEESLRKVNAPTAIGRHKDVGTHVVIKRVALFDAHGMIPVFNTRGSIITALVADGGEGAAAD